MEQLSRGAKNSINAYFQTNEPWQVVTITATTVLASVWLWEFIFQEESLWSRTKKQVFRLARRIPAVSRRVDAELAKITASFERDITLRSSAVPYILRLPDQGLERTQVVLKINEYLQLGDFQWKNGYVSGTVYYFDSELIRLLTEVYGLASYTNPLHPDVFPGICKMEAEVVRITANLFHGGPNTCGTMTTGGTESIMMACKAYRDYAKAERGIRRPEIVVPVTAHPAFDKAAAYFGLKVTHVPVDPVTMAADLRAMRRAINASTCMLVGSMPNFPYGTMDDIVGIASLGRRYSVPVHVDCCLGGFIIAFMPAAGFRLPEFDFALPGVTSISADTHKYGFAPKGSSVVLYSEAKYRHHQYCVTTEWPGGIYGSPTINGSRAGGIIAACWATLMHFGFSGYVKTTKAIVTTTRHIENELRKMEDLFVFGVPITTVIAFGSKRFHIYRLSEALNLRGWNLNPLQFPPGIHLCVTHMHTAEGVADRFIYDIRQCLIEIMKEPDLKVEGKMAMYGMSQGIPDRSIVGDFTRAYIDSMYYTPQAKQHDEEPPLNGHV